jgi:hypothetical protein
MLHQYQQETGQEFKTLLGSCDRRGLDAAKPLDRSAAVVAVEGPWHSSSGIGPQWPMNSRRFEGLSVFLVDW